MDTIGRMILGSALVLCLCAVGPAFAETPAPAEANQVSLSLGAGLGLMNGNTKYHISSYDATGGIESELEFPLSSTFFALEGSLASKDSKNRDLFTARLRWLTSIMSPSGTMKDSDWLSDSIDIVLVGQAHPGIDIYSTSQAELNANILDLRATASFWPTDKVAIGPLGGFLYEKFKYDVSNLNQVGFGPYAPGATGTVLGSVLTYEVTYTALYVGGRAEGRFENGLRASVDLGYSPWASAKDKDNHLLRYKLSEGDTTGSAYFAELSGTWQFDVQNSVALEGRYRKITTTGPQTQTWYFAPNPDGLPAGTTAGGIQDRITSELTSLTLLFRHGF